MHLQVYLCFFLASKREFLVLGIVHRLNPQSCRWVLPSIVAHLHITGGFLCSQFVLKDVMAGSSFTEYRGEEAEVQGACSELTS